MRNQFFIFIKFSFYWLFGCNFRLYNYNMFILYWWIINITKIKNINLWKMKLVSFEDVISFFVQNFCWLTFFFFFVELQINFSNFQHQTLAIFFLCDFSFKFLEMEQIGNLSNQQKSMPCCNGNKTSNPTFRIKKNCEQKIKIFLNWG